MCDKLPNNEWSGILFYKYKGSFKENNISFEAVDFLLMDIGSSGFTEFDMNADVSAYMVEKPELLDCKTGLIHSHAAMNTFFSSTDINTLETEGNEKTHFLSLIVNNAGTYSAKITSKTTEVLIGRLSKHFETFDCDSEDTDTEIHTEETVITVYDLCIVKNITIYDADIESRYNFIKSKFDKHEDVENGLFTPIAHFEKNTVKKELENPNTSPSLKIPLKTPVIKKDIPKDEDKGFTDAIKFLNKLFSLDILCNTMIQDIKELDKIFNEKSNLLKKGGFNIINIETDYCEMLLNTIFEDYNYIKTDNYGMFTNTVASYLSNSTICGMNDLRDMYFIDGIDY